MLNIDGLNILEGSHRVGVLHSTYLENGSVTCAAGFGPEGQHRGVERQSSGVELRQHDDTVVTV